MGKPRNNKVRKAITMADYTIIVDEYGSKDAAIQSAISAANAKESEGNAKISENNAADSATEAGNIVIGAAVANVGNYTAEIKVSEVITKYPWVDVRAFGFIGGNIDETSHIQAALDYLNGLGTGGNVFVPQSCLFSSLLVPSSITLRGKSKYKTILKQIVGRSGYGVRSINTDNPCIKNLTIDSSDASIEGGFVFTGVVDGLVENVIVKNADFASIVVGGYVAGQGAIRVSENCIVKNCEAYGQRTWNGECKAQMIACDEAVGTKFIDCYSHDSAADLFDADNAPNTEFIRCKASNTVNAGFWSEGEQAGVRQVKISNCKTDTCGIAVGISENTQATVDGCDFLNSGYTNGAFWFNTAVKGIISNCTFNGCGKDSSRGAIFIDGENLTVSGNSFTSSIGADLNIYTGSAGGYNGSNKIIGNTFTGDVWLFNENGTKNAMVSNNTFLAGSVLRWFNANLCNFNVNGNTFLDAVIYGSRVGHSSVSNNTFIDTTGLKTAITCDLDTFNTDINDNVFIGHLDVTLNGTLGKNIYKNVVNTPKATPKPGLGTVLSLVADTWTDIPGTNVRGCFMITVQGTTSDTACSIVSALCATYTVDRLITKIAEVASYGGTNVFAFQWLPGGNIQVKHANAMAVSITVMGG